MNVVYFLSVGFILVITSCFLETKQTVSLDVATNEENDTPHSSIDAIESGDIPYKQHFWSCGVEWIVVKKPDDGLIISKIPLECDPFADVYFGDPEINNDQYVQEKTNKKSPENNSGLN